MSVTVDEVQSQLAAILDQNESASDISSDDYSLRLKYMNMSLLEWAEANEWQSLYKEFNMLVSTSTGNASIAMPADFRKPTSQPIISYDSANSQPFLIIQPQNDVQYDEFKKRVAFLGNPADGYTMRVYGVSLNSGASVKLPYFSVPQSLASPTNIIPVPNTNFILKRTLAYWWEAREDARFPSAKAESQQILQNMIEFENIFPQGADNSQVKTVEQTTYRFRVGRD